MLSSLLHKALAYSAHYIHKPPIIRTWKVYTQRKTFHLYNFLARWYATTAFYPCLKNAYSCK